MTLLTFSFIRCVTISIYSLWGAFHAVAFNTIILLLTFSHLRAVFSDPGIVPLPQSKLDFAELHTGLLYCEFLSSWNLKNYVQIISRKIWLYHNSNYYLKVTKKNHPKMNTLFVQDVRLSGKHLKSDKYIKAVA